LIVVFIGAPGAGKGTQAAIVARKLNLAHLSSGDLFRKAVESGEELGKKVKSYMDRGALVPDEITTSMVLDGIKRVDKQGVILDGFPRSLAQAEALNQALKSENIPVARVIYIKVNEEELLRRLSGRWLCRSCQCPYNLPEGIKAGQTCPACGGELYQRPDDAADTVKKRLAVYFKETAPLIEYYRQQGKLSEIDGEGEVSQVTHRILGILKRNQV
jgi:adenylate kinase